MTIDDTMWGLFWTYHPKHRAALYAMGCWDEFASNNLHGFDRSDVPRALQEAACLYVIAVVSNDPAERDRCCERCDKLIVPWLRRPAGTAVN